MFSERIFIDRIRRAAGRTVPGLRLGIGDDAAAVAPTPGRLMVAASDLLAEDVHFRRRYFSPGDLGFKVLAVNLSDMAAMGAIPRWCLLNLALPRDGAERFGEECIAGLLDLADAAGVTLIGGDTSASNGGILLDVTILGEVEPDAILTRSGARPGDRVFVSGELGAAAAGLKLLENEAVAPMTEPDRRAIRRHLKPDPRLALGRFLAVNRLATAAMDISDGLSLDLSRLAEASAVGAVIESGKIPVFASASGQNGLDLALNGGEDFELLFTVAPENADRVSQAAFSEAVGGVGLTDIGTIHDVETGVLIEQNGLRKPLWPAGFDHFGADSAASRPG